MTTTVPAAEQSGVRPVSLDLYRDIHKGIRSELFAVTLKAGSTDPSDDPASVELAAHVGRVVDLLASHAEHEDDMVQPAIAAHLPDLAARIASDHEVLEARMAELRTRAATLVEVPHSERRSEMQGCHLALASFTSTYLEHQDVEERVVMPALEAAIGFDAVLAIHEAIISSIPPDELAQSLAIMLPAMSIDDRAEMLGGMQQSAPPEVFADVWSLATSVLAPSDHRTLAARLELT